MSRGPQRSGRSGTLFETPAERILAAAPSDVADLLRTFLAEPLRAVPELRSEVRSYLAELVSLSRDAEFLDLRLARRIAAQCEVLLDGIRTSGSEDAHRLVQAAVRYFVEDEDAEGDTTSPIGFDDDAAVIELIAREIGREDVLAVTAKES